MFRFTLSRQLGSTLTIATLTLGMICLGNRATADDSGLKVARSLDAHSATSAAEAAVSKTDEARRSAFRGWSRYSDHATAEVTSPRRRSAAGAKDTWRVPDLRGDRRADGIVRQGILQHAVAQTVASDVHDRNLRGAGRQAGLGLGPWGRWGGWLADPELPGLLSIKSLMKSK